MAETVAATGLIPQHWKDTFFQEYHRKNRFRRYMGTSPTSLIHVTRDLTRLPGDKVTFATVRRLRGQGVTTERLRGREEKLDSRSMALTVAPLRHGVIVDKWQRQLSAIDLAGAARPELRLWASERLEADLIAGMQSINGVAYGTATAGQRNTWLVDNTDRVLFGRAVANHVSGVMATALATIDSTNDKLTPQMISLAKRRAMTADPPIQPLMTEGADGEEEMFVMFVPSLVMRDLAQNADMIAALKEARERGIKNPLFQGGDLIWDKVIVKEVTKIPVLAGVGDSGIDVGPCFLCGAQALGVAWAMMTDIVTDDDDYKWEAGVAIQEIRGIDKLRFGTGTSGDTSNVKQAGIVNVYASAVADA